MPHRPRMPTPGQAQQRLPDLHRRAIRRHQNGNSYTWKGDWWIADMFSYSHTSTPNRKSCWYSDVGGRPWSGDRERGHLGFAAPGRRQRGVLRRLGPVHQELDQSPDVAGARDEERGRGRQLRRLLICVLAGVVSRPAVATCLGDGTTCSPRRVGPADLVPSRGDPRAMSLPMTSFVRRHADSLIRLPIDERSRSARPDRPPQSGEFASLGCGH